MSTTQSRNRLIWFLQTTTGLLLLWLALNGWNGAWAGLVFALLGASAGAWLVPTQVYPWRPIRLAFFFLYFLRASFRGGTDVALRALSRRLAIDPQLVQVRLSLPSGLPQTMMVLTANLIPGSLSVELSNGVLQAHVLVPRAAEGLAELERQIGRLFSSTIHEVPNDE